MQFDENKIYKRYMTWTQSWILSRDRRTHVSNSRPAGQIWPLQSCDPARISLTYLSTQSILARLVVRQTKSCLWHSEIPTEPESFHIQAVKQVAVKYVIIVLLDLLNSMMAKELLCWLFRALCRPNCKWESYMRRAIIQSKIFDFLIK